MLQNHYLNVNLPSWVYFNYLKLVVFGNLNQELNGLAELLHCKQLVAIISFTVEKYLIS